MMFVAHDVLLDVSFDVAQPRLVSLASSRALVDASRAAYLEGVTSLIRAGPVAGPADADPAPRLARVRLLPPVERADAITVGLRWEASGVSVGLFPVLDADITLAAASEHTTTLTLSGVYRTAADGATLLGAPVAEALSTGALAATEALPATDPAQLAETTIRALLRYAAGYLTGLIE
ncbi:MAG: hypothetical protein JO016_12175 [Actinobacteria bacterium]|nr:hypothetical protein [Actinomycetota bacterium]